MFEIFSQLADLVVYQLAGLKKGYKWADALHFFIEDTTKIFVLLLIMIYGIALLRASLNVEKVRDFLSRRHRVFGYLFGATFGAITPFCSCSSIPLFLGFTSAGIPIGITMAFLITSPIINELAVILLFSLLGWQLTLLYIAIGLAIGILCGVILDLMKAEKLLLPFAAKAYANSSNDLRNKQKPTKQEVKKLSLHQRHLFAKKELLDIFKRVWKWIFIGVGAGAALHGFVPDGWLATHLNESNWWAVPSAVLLGIPLYANATGIIPVMESLLKGGLPLGTTLAFCMSTIAVSFPEFVMLKQVMQWRLLAIIAIMLLLAFTLSGWLLNLFHYT